MPLIDSGTAKITDVDLGDPDQDNKFSNATITVTLDNYVDGDKLTVDSSVDSDLYSIDTTNDGDGTKLVISLASGTTATEAEQVIEGIRFHNEVDNPTDYGSNTQRGYTITFNDGGNYGSGDPLSDDLTGTIEVADENDPPVATDNSHTITEDASPNTVNGNVITDDDGSGSDSDPDDTVDNLKVDGVIAGDQAGPASGSVGSSVTGSYGSIQINSDGSYTYTLDNSNADVQALDDNESLIDTFTYTISDPDGATST